jgi:ribonuclease HI
MGTEGKRWYAVIRGRSPGVYPCWSGPQGAEAQVKGFPGALFKGFASLAEAREALARGRLPATGSPAARTRRPRSADRAADRPEGERAIRLYTDGGCRQNPGPGGWGVVLITGGERREASGGFRLTTNNRMEIFACIAGLSMLPGGSLLTLYSDSRYVINALALGWARRWRAQGWRRADGPARNPDLWERLLALYEARSVHLVWVKGHAGHPENERCDRLAGEALRLPGLPPDAGYEASARPAG